MMRQFGDVIGMTGYPEVVLAREAGLCYASLCIVTNPACGMAEGLALKISDASELMKSSNEVVREILYLAVQKISDEGACTCSGALSAARL
jgi:5'-methylthioadenosine phosphorylase